MNCSICQGPIDTLGSWVDGNNAYPFVGRCCSDCDNRFVTPARTLRIGATSDLIPILLEFARQGRMHTQAHAALVSLRQRQGLTDAT
jgi:hypothetical protein